MPNFIKVYHAGQTSFQIGSNLNQFDFVDVRNVAHAHVLAAAGLSAPPTPPAVFASRLGPVHATVPYRHVPTSLHLDPTTSPNPSPDPPLPAHRNRFNQFANVPAEGIPVAGEAFFITNGEPVPFWDIAKAVWFEYSGREQPFVIRIGRTVGTGLAWMIESWAGLVGTRIQDVGLTRHRVGYVTDHMYFDIEKVSWALNWRVTVNDC